MNEYLTISEYAKLKGISTTAVYKRLNGSLKPFQTVVNGKKCLLSTVLELDENKGSKPFQPKFETKFETGFEAPNSPAAAGIEQAFSALQKQLEEKDRQIERLQEETAELRRAGAEKDKFIQDQSAKLSLLLEQSQELQRNNQILLGYSQTKPKEEIEEETEPERETEQKKSFWKKFFRKK